VSNRLDCIIYECENAHVSKLKDSKEDETLEAMVTLEDVLIVLDSVDTDSEAAWAFVASMLVVLLPLQE
jgi:hypothetical protein